MIRSRASIKVKGLNQERVINNISKKITIFNLKRKDDVSEFEVEYKNRKIIKKMLSQENLKIVSTSYSGIVYSIKKLTSSFGVLLGIIVSILCYITQYFFIWKVEVNGIENSEEITKYIENNLKSRLKTQINTKNMEIEVKKQFKEVSSISSAIIGQSLIVNVNKAVLPDEMKNEFYELKSNFDGVITQIKLIQGTLNCHVGDIVKSGDILVYPYVFDSQGEKRNVQPKAEIIADVWLTTTETHYDYLIKTERTDKKIVSTQVYLGNILLYDQKLNCSFSEYESETEEKILTKNLILPFKIKKTTYYETQTFEINENFLDNKMQIIEDIRSKTLLFLDKNEIIKCENCVVNDTINSHTINYTITVSRNIGG